jgi:hypothetical protein
MTDDQYKTIIKYLRLLLGMSGLIFGLLIARLM